MSTALEGELLWTPSDERRYGACLTDYMRWLAERGRSFASYGSLWEWSIDDQEGFWGSLWDYFAVIASAPYERVLGSRAMPGAEWFAGSRLNYAEHALRHERPGVDALMCFGEARRPSTLSLQELGGSVRKLATRLRALGIAPGDRVVAYLPNSPEAVIAMLATVSVGAIWASCSPDFGPAGVVDRFLQLEPRLAFCVDGYHYGGKAFDRRESLGEILSSLPSLQTVVLARLLHPMSETRLTAHTSFWEEMLDGPEVSKESFEFEQVPFAHPLWILFSSGTTGLPKPIIHSHGGMVIELHKELKLMKDLHPREKVFFFTTTGWMMWNFLVSALLIDAVPVLYDGNPAHPGPDVLWSVVEKSGASFFGASPAYVGLLQRAGIVPKNAFDLSKLKSVMLAGSPVTADVSRWFYRNVKADVWAFAGSGGTDLCTGIVGGVVLQPLYAGEIQGPQLGVAAFAFNEAGNPVVNEVGELVITKPLPCMPVGFWNDPADGRYRESYFDVYPGIWRHGDFFKVNERGGCFVLGRSDATLNRFGVRIGTAEVYRALAGVPQIEDSLIVNLDLPGGKFFMPLFVKLPAGAQIDDALRGEAQNCMRKAYSARHVPDRIYQVPDIPYTLTGKKMEVPVRRILMGMPVERAANRAAMANVESLDYFVHYAATQTDYVR
jgi:acetoacetyl-CoA synthetase